MGRGGSAVGNERPYPPSNGVFPATGKITPELMEEGPEIEMQSHVTNYKSFVEAPDAEIEVQRYVQKGFAILMDWEEVQAYFDRGTVSRQEKPDGSVKRRVVVDLLRWCGNDRTTTPERIVLPRNVDVTKMARDIAVKNEGGNEDRSAEFVLYNLQDAFCHFPVCREELGKLLGAWKQREPGNPLPGPALWLQISPTADGQAECCGGKNLAVVDVAYRGPAPDLCG